MASNCEDLKSSQNMSFGDIPLSIIKANATAGPLKVASYTAQSGRVLSATTDVAAGDLSIDQIIDLAGAQQALKGWVCGINSDTMAKYADGKETYANTMLGSGIMPNLFHQVSWKDARCNVEYKYSPVSYQTGTYDIKLNLSKVES
jgi:hypothetical protein